MDQLLVGKPQLFGTEHGNNQTESQKRREEMADDTKRLPVTKPSVPATSEAWSPLERMRDEIDRLFDSFSLFDLRFPQRRPGLSSAHKAAVTWELAPAMDVVEKADSYEITAELPGLSENDIEVKLSNHSLVIMGEKTEE